jgi:integrase
MSTQVTRNPVDREKSILEGVRRELGTLFVREVDGVAVHCWYRRLMDCRGLSAGTAVRHFNVIHHMMEKACTLWSKETGIDCLLSKYLSIKKIHRAGTREINQTFHRLRMIVLIALTTGMRMAEIFGLTWGDVRYTEGLIAVRSKLKGGKIRYVPLTPELASELRKYPAVIDGGRIFPPKRGAKGERQRVDGSFETLLALAQIQNFRFHDLRHTFASWYMMNGGDLYELAKILGHSNIRMTERYAKLGKTHMPRTGEKPRTESELTPHGPLR